MLQDQVRGASTAAAVARRRAPSPCTRIVQSRSQRFVGGAGENGSGCVSDTSVAQAPRLPELIEVVLQAPALEARAAVGEHGDHVARFEMDVVFAWPRRQLSPRSMRLSSELAVPLFDAAEAALRSSPAPAPDAVAIVPAAVVAVVAVPDGFGTGFTTSVWAQIENQERKEDRDENSSFHCLLCAGAPLFSTAPGAPPPGALTRAFALARAHGCRHLCLRALRRSALFVATFRSVKAVTVSSEPGRGRRRTAGDNGRGAWRRASPREPDRAGSRLQQHNPHTTGETGTNPENEEKCRFCSREAAIGRGERPAMHHRHWRRRRWRRLR